MHAFLIHDDADHARAVALIDRLWNAEPGTREHDTLDVMATLVDAYEAAHTTLPPADPLTVIRFKLRELGWSQRELGRRLAWGAGRVSEVLSGKRPLTLRMVTELGRVLDLPPGILVHDVREDAQVTWMPVSPTIAAKITDLATRTGTTPADALASLVYTALGAWSATTASSGAPSFVEGHQGCASPSMVCANRADRNPDLPLATAA